MEEKGNKAPKAQAAKAVKKITKSEAPDTSALSDDQEVEAVPFVTAEPSAAGVSAGWLPDNLKSQKAMLLAGVVIVVVLLGLLMLFGWRPFGGDDTDPALADQAQNEEEINEILAELSELLLLPSEEVPLVATVVDAESLRSEQPFYSNAEADDRLLIFAESQQAILYRPSDKKIINMGPVYFDQDAEEAPEGTDELE